MGGLKIFYRYILLTVSLFFCNSLSGFAEDDDPDFLVDNIWYNILSPTEVEVAGFFMDSESPELTVPPAVKYLETNYTVVSLGYACFNSFNGTSIILPNTITTIQPQAFIHSSNLESIKIPESITQIGYGAFINCSSLVDITLPESLTTIEQGMFENCISLKEISVPSKVKVIENGAFLNCASLENITLPEGLEEICNSAFGSCSSLRQIILPNTLIYLGYSAFAGCSSLEEITLPENLTEMESNIFQFCTSLKKITIPEGINTLGGEVFSNCISLEEVNLPKELSIIGVGCFFECLSLTEIELPKNIQYIYSSAFAECSSLESITIFSVEPPVISIDTFNNVPFSTCNLYVPFDGIYNYTNNTVWRIFEHILPISEISEEGSYIIINQNEAIYSSVITEETESVIIPESVMINDEEYAVTSISEDAFAGCGNLISVEIPTTITEIGANAFANCSSLSSLTCMAPVPPDCGTNCFENVDTSVCSLYVPENSLTLYQSIAPWSEFVNLKGIGDAGLNFIPDCSENQYKVYDLNGIEVLKENKNENLQTLKKGVYIINNRKVIIK